MLLPVADEDDGLEEQVVILELGPGQGEEQEYLSVLNDYITMIHVGTADGSDTYGALNTDSKIGVTKTAWNNMEYMPVVYTEYIPDGDNLLTNGFYGANQIVSDELQQFGLFEYP